MDRDSIVTQSGPALSGAPAQTLTVRQFYDQEGRLKRLERLSSPDPGNISTIVTQWQYDLAGRPTVEIAPDGQQELCYYDRASNLDSVRTRRGHGAATSSR